MGCEDEINAHSPEIERERYNRMIRNERFCQMCTHNKIEDENHIWHCLKYQNETEIIMTKLSKFYPNFKKYT